MNNTTKLVAGMALLLIASGNVLGQAKPLHVLMVGGRTSHDFGRWYGQEDVQTIESTGKYRVTYTEHTDSIPVYLKMADLLILTNNRPINAKGQAAITKFVEKGH